MPNILSYEDLRIEVITATANPGNIVKLACDMTMKHAPNIKDATTKVDDKVLRFLYTAEHTSVLEHCSITMFIQGVSRSFLAQMTRHRHASVTSQSQHYQTYSDMPLVMDEYPAEVSYAVQEVLSKVYEAYNRMLEVGMPKEEARQILPTAATTNILWTVNARGLISFLRPRMCWRNVKEMKIFADKLHAICLKWWPELFRLIGPSCYLGVCNQGTMRPKVCGDGKVYPGARYDAD